MHLHGTKVLWDKDFFTVPAVPAPMGTFNCLNTLVRNYPYPMRAYPFVPPLFYAYALTSGLGDLEGQTCKVLSSETDQPQTQLFFSQILDNHFT